VQGPPCGNQLFGIETEFRIIPTSATIESIFIRINVRSNRVNVIETVDKPVSKAMSHDDCSRVLLQRGDDEWCSTRHLAENEGYRRL
jgi:hypothetical protein